MPVINKQTFECEVSETFITVEYDKQRKIFWIKKYYIDPSVSESNLLGILLSSMVGYLKKKKILYLIMSIPFEEWDDIKQNSAWTVVRTIDEVNLIEIQCCIDDVFDCLLDGFCKKS